MPVTVLDLQQAWIDGAELSLTRGRLLVQRNDPLPGLPGTWRWSATLLPEKQAVRQTRVDGAHFRATTTAGTDVSGLVRVDPIRIGDHAAEGLELTGLGPLAGFDEALLT